MKSNIKKYSIQSGQALIALLFFVLMAVGIATSAVIVVSTNSLSTSDLQEGIATRQMADSGAEIAAMALLRSPSYTGETLSINGGVVEVTVTGDTTKTIVSEATNGDFTKKVEFIVTYSNNILVPGAWKEIN